MNNREIKGALFDLDGVIIDTETTYSYFWQKVDEAFPTNVPHFSDVIKGSNLDTILNTYFPVEKHAAVVEMLNSFQREMDYPYFAGAMEMVDEMRARGIVTCVVTSSDRKKMEALYAQHPDFASHFSAIITGDMVSAPKPDPECFLLGAAKIGIPIEQCVVFEDSFNGIAAGQSAGAMVVAVATTNPASSLRSGSECVINQLSDFDLDALV